MNSNFDLVVRVGLDRIDLSEMHGGWIRYVSTILTLLVSVHSKPSDGHEEECRVLQPWEPISGKVL